MTCFPDGLVVRNPPASAGDTRDMGSVPGSGRSLGVGNGNLVFLPGKSHGQRSLACCSPWSHKESYRTEHKMIQSIQEDVYRLDANNMPFYI